ncbi:AbrB family transcriptional regulator [Sulfitobacter sabulilitoris]|uniref:AbrB family transcriptional regulator n=1 Tax=Sulfitobacter sabulilitoris TaxID=2562655 RepID=A0A5S3PMM5_9RHOB|nr:AbrB family transcriptional regulator [Sulfitobacter sabulilitoris]TMM55649.1 AbrB family transcriptional regulator [Sulfitobacter sabulilitoris]
MTFAVALAGALAFRALGLPLPWLLGPMAGCLVASLSGARLHGIRPLNDAMRAILGVAVGASFTPALLGDLAGMWPTLALMPVMIVVIGALGVPYFQRLWGYDFATSYYAAMPGGLQDMLLFGHEAGGNLRALSLIHATRVLVIVVALPVLLVQVWDASLDAAPGAPIRGMDPGQIALMALCGVVGWRVARRAGLFGASILGPMIATGALALAGILTTPPPAEAIFLAQFFIGMAVGQAYSGITWVEVRRDLIAGAGFCIVLIALTLAVVEVIWVMDLAPPREAVLAFAPGGQAELAVLALIVGADIGFVIAHHVLRMVVVILGAPLVARLLGPRGRRDERG